MDERKESRKAHVIVALKTAASSYSNKSAMISAAIAWIGHVNGSKDDFQIGMLFYMPTSCHAINRQQ